MKKISIALKSTQAAIDLASIMVGILVIGIIGGVIAATVFAVIPWAQNNAAKATLDSVYTAQSAYYGFTDGTAFATKAQLADPGSVVPDGKALLKAGNEVQIATSSDASCYVAIVISQTGDRFYATNTTTKPELYVGQSIDCNAVIPGSVDPAVFAADYHAGAVDDDGANYYIDGFYRNASWTSGHAASAAEMITAAGSQTLPTVADAPAGYTTYKVPVSGELYNNSDSASRLSVANNGSLYIAVTIKDDMSQLWSFDYVLSVTATAPYTDGGNTFDGSVYWVFEGVDGHKVTLDTAAASPNL